MRPFLPTSPQSGGNFNLLEQKNWGPSGQIHISRCSLCLILQAPEKKCRKWHPITIKQHFYQRETTSPLISTSAPTWPSWRPTLLSSRKDDTVKVWKISTSNNLTGYVVLQYRISIKYKTIFHHSRWRTIRKWRQSLFWFTRLHSRKCFFYFFFSCFQMKISDEEKRRHYCDSTVPLYI